jgi:hypothetical protein
LLEKTIDQLQQWVLIGRSTKVLFFFFFFSLSAFCPNPSCPRCILVVPIVLGLVGTSWFPLQGQDMYNKAQSVQHQNVSGHHPSFNDGLGWKAYKEKRKTSKQYFRTASNKNLNPKPFRRIVS